MILYFTYNYFDLPIEKQIKLITIITTADFRLSTANGKQN